MEISQKDVTRVPDVQRLLELLDMTPGAEALGIDQSDVMWIAFAAAHPAGLDPDYVTEKLGDWMRDLREKGTWYEVLRLSGYCLAFFNVAEHQRACEALAVIGRPEVPEGLRSAVGKLWLTSVTEVSWRLFVTARTQVGRDL